MAVTYYAILTAVGAAKLANAAALGTTLQITQMAVGDGNGNVPVPDANRTTLVNEVRRAPLNQLKIDPSNASQIIAEQVIPETVGGWWIREIGLLDNTGALIAIANCAPSYKPQLAEGSGRTQTVRMVLIVNNTGSVELKIDPSVVLATREYCDSAILTAINRQDAKASVRAATTANIALNGLLTVDGVVLVAGDRVLVKNQGAGSQNGIYVVAAGAWARSADADENAEVTPSLTVSVESGTTQADTVWQLITDAPIVVGTTALVFQDITNGLARLASPAFTGTPTAPKPAQDTNTPQLATTEFVMAQAATQTEAEAGANDKRWMSPLRVFQAIAKKVVQATEAIVGIAAIATQTQTNTGTDDATIVTPKKLRAGFAISINTNGYIAFPTWMGGLIFQWGRVPIPTGSAEGSGSVSLPLTFPTGPLLPIASLGHGGTSGSWYGFNAWCSVLGSSSITCTLHTDSTTRTETGYVNFLAIGR
ncbi:phage tail protein [Pseudomonas nitroreducens]|uniref:phage tail protein n=1 Tax=Pseudomonas nitroreducens TaxID=46680 RepID=UPI002448B2E9|nr:phage tail protein [Pseudomonas nitroreducens]MDG9854124.1 phage tail protein [Pseudomonas nitroreducens]